MQVLKEITQILSKYKLETIPVLGCGTKQQKQQIAALYEAIITTESPSDEYLAQTVLDSTPDSRNYKKLKSNLKDQLMNCLFFIDTSKSDFNDYPQAYVNCCREWAAARILLGKNARKSGIDICKKIFKQVLKADITSLVINIADLMSYYYATHEVDSTKFEEYSGLVDLYLKILDAEDEVEEAYCLLQLQAINSNNDRNQVRTSAQESWKDLAPLLQQYDTYNLHLYGRFIQILALDTTKDAPAIVDACDSAIEFFQAKPLFAKTALLLFYHQKLLTYINLKAFKKGMDTAKQCLEYLDLGTHNWVKHQQLRFYLSMHTQNYDTAYTILKETVNHKNFKSIHVSTQEEFQLLIAYIQFLIHIEKIEQDTLNKFKLKKFLQEIPTFCEEKRAINTATLLIQILFFISIKKYDPAIDCIEAIETYGSRYLKKDKRYRINCLIKMLSQVWQGGFHKVGVMRRTETLYEKLKAEPIDISNEQDTMEIIPYEDLWELLLSFLGKKHYERRR